MKGWDIVYNSDEKFLRFVSVSMVSLLENCRDAERISFHVLGSGLLQESMDRLSRMVGSYGEGRSVSFIDISDIRGRIDEDSGSAVETGRFGYAAFGRIMAPSLLPGVKELLYLDGDTLVLRSLSLVFEHGVSEGDLASMAMEPTIYPEVKAEAGLSEEEPYYNSGVIFMDAEAWRREDIYGKSMEYLSRKNGELGFPDQDILNHVLKGRVTPLPQCYNFIAGYRYQSYGHLKKKAAWFAPPKGREGFEKARRDPAVLHFAGDERPWIRGNLSHYRHIYRRYAALTPWKDEKDLPGNRLYMLAYHMVDLLTFLAPGLRDRISDIYYKTRVRKRIVKE